jgi:hypothetical protein
MNEEKGEKYEDSFPSVHYELYSDILFINIYMINFPLISSFTTIAAISLAVLYQKNKIQEIKKDFGNKGFLIPLALTLLFAFVVLNLDVGKKDKDKVVKMQIATKRAVVALIVAYFARIDLVIAPFWLVWVFAFWQGGDSSGWV